ncbi:anthranilate phosphoribosyltransferase [Thermostichus vulcanus]|uniref:Anthranilate phosphoribosyltransferase n=1 Tax=Thermostichus vulcanus str. 'Rupite' TaxID=2813851 RepID=A0ABT0C7A1_THEVL|nr:anthranilate phosphoribosyltransferase [Thermostichus vulcanus]MCJ2541631.1 anthranilate phosphoribosyltransferase [Thermostichus vulcanus str. 'Rupite']
MTDAADLWPQLLAQLLDRQSLSEAQAEQLMNGWLDHQVPDVVSGAILAALQAKGVSASELAGMARVLQRASIGSPLDLPLLVDTCGTGGDGAGTFNISTAVAFVVSAAGIPVVKHGNRSASSKVGSADVLEALGVNLAAEPERVRAAASEVGITFLFAPNWHPAMRAVVPYRRALKIRTIFNLLGPLVNPFYPNRQVIGVYAQDLVPILAEALQLLGREGAIVLHSREGLDEAGLDQPTDLGVLAGGTVQAEVLDPRDYGLTSAPTQALKGGELAENTAILTQVLQGSGEPAQRDVVALNAALALQVAGAAPDWGAGIAQAQDILASGAAWARLQQLVDFLKS